MECPICKDQVYIPVSIICFPCFRRNEVHCHTFTRFCLFCAFQYLSLNISRLHRPSRVRCIFCDQTASPRRLTSLDTALEYDFVLANTLEVKQCPFCFSSTERIFDHLKECPYLPIQCHCGFVTLRELQKYHRLQCSHYRKCNLCSELILKDELEKHMFDIHQFMPCLLCGQQVFAPLIMEHQRSFCQHRKIECCVCNSKVAFKDLEVHYQNHVEKLESLLTKMDILTSDIRLTLSKIREEVQKHFQPLVLR